MLKSIGLWITGLQDELRPAPQELVGEMRAEDRLRLARYLDAGMIYEMYLGFSWCRFGCGIDQTRMGTKELSDSRWAWPEGLSHYVREHGVLLPEEFIQEALARTTPVIEGWAEANGPFSESKERTNEEYWQTWCATRRTPHVHDRLHSLRLAAEALAASESIADTTRGIAALVRKHGLSDASCIWKGCSHKALGGHHICAEHRVERDPERRRRKGFRRVLAELNATIGLQPARSAQRSSGLIARGIARMTRLFQANH
jgi:hypothetical protein